MAAVLDGVRVIDFGRYIAGPHCSCLLGDLGAEVIRVERVGGGEDRFLQPLGDGQSGATFLSLNRNKKSVTLDPATEEGRDIVRRLVKTADIVVANLPPNALAHLGLDYESLRAIKPDIVMTSINAFGSGGPWSNKLGLDGIAQVMSGLVYVSGRPGDPQKLYGPWVDYMSGTLSAYGTLAALLWRNQTGEGQHVEANLLKSAMLPASPLLAEQGATGINRTSTGNRSQTAAPSDLYQTLDGWIIVQVVGNPMFKRLCKMIGQEAWIGDERFSGDEARAASGEEISLRMSKWTRERTSIQALAELEAFNLPAAPLLRAQEVLDHEHVNAIGALQSVKCSGITAPVPLLTTPVHLSASPGSIRSAPPKAGEHTDEVLASLGYPQTKIAELRERGLV